MSCLGINQIFLYTCDTWECERAGDEMCHFGSVMLCFMSSGGSGHEGTDAVADGYVKFAVTIQGLGQSLFLRYCGEGLEMNLYFFLEGTTVELMFVCFLTQCPCLYSTRLKD